ELVSKADLFEQVWPGVIVGDAALSRAVHEVRLALGDSASEPRYIATVHGLGFRFIAPFELALQESSDRATSTDGPGLIGRESDLDRLAAGLAGARRGHRQAVFVTGEAGIGKTALVDRFVARHVGGGDVWLAQGRCIEQFGPGEAHLPILEALEQLARQA